MPTAQRLYIATYSKLGEKRIVGVYTSERKALNAIENDAAGFGLGERWYGIDFNRLDVDAWAASKTDDEEGDDE